jgi:hypothetical protein
MDVGTVGADALAAEALEQQRARCPIGRHPRAVSHR